MGAHARIYRTLIHLYPKSFTSHYDDDLVQHFGDLVARDGATRAWGRTTLDLLLTVPMYRLETVMNPRHANTGLQLSIAGLSVAGVVSILIGIYPGAALLAIAVVVAVAQRSRLGRSVRTPDPDRRRRLLRIAAILAFACVVGSIGMFVEVSRSEDWNGGKLALYNLYFFATAIGAIGYLFAGLRTPHHPIGNHGTPVPS